MQAKTNLIVFDIDGTLTESVEVHQAAFKNTLKRIGVINFNDQFGTYKHHTDSYIAKYIYESFSNNKFDKETSELFENHLLEFISQYEIKEIEGAKQFVDFVENETNFGVCFATGSMYLPATFKLHKAGIKFEPNLLVASNVIEEREKIVEKAIERSLKHYKVNEFERIISFGDGIWDLVTAKNLSIEFVGIGEKNREVLYANGMDRHYPNFMGLTIQELLQLKN